MVRCDEVGRWEGREIVVVFVPHFVTKEGRGNRRDGKATAKHGQARDLPY